MVTVIPKRVIRNEPIILEPLLHGGLCDVEVVDPASCVELVGLAVVELTGVSVGSLGHIAWSTMHFIIRPAISSPIS